MNQNKNRLIWAIVIIILVIIAFVLISKAPAPSNTSPTDQTSATSPETSAVNTGQGTTAKTVTVVSSNNVKTTTSSNPAPSDVLDVTPKSLRQLVASGQPLKCTFTDTSAMYGVEGTVYIYGSKIRGDLSVSYDGTTRTHEIALGEDTYVWSDAVATGTKSTLAMSSSPTATPNKNGINADKKVGYRCNKWTLDSSKFVLPPNVTFKAE